MSVEAIALGVSFLSLAIWVGLLGFWGGFWQANQRLHAAIIEKYPSVWAIVPARNEAELLPITLRSLLTQDYPGLAVVLVDDGSTDGTAQVAQEVAADTHRQLKVLSAQPLPSGWTGKLWALNQGISYAQEQLPPPDYLLLSDADIEHHSTNLRELVSKAETENLDLVSLMVLLRCQSAWEKLLIPAFVFFFQKLYPFGLVNDPQSRIAAAAGGCILIRSQALNCIGGMAAVRQALIDDCALAQAVKSHRLEGRIWLGLSEFTRSLRPYPSLKSIWDLVARTAFTQLNYSSLLLVGTVAAMFLIYLVPPLAVVLGVLMKNWLVAIAGLSGWLLMAGTYWPTLKLYGCSPGRSLSLPGVAFLYTLMTIDSALRHWRGQGGAWKGRVYGDN